MKLPPRLLRLLAPALALAVLAPSAFAQRQMEKLGRGVVAVRTGSTQVYVGWRLLGNDPEDIAFNVWRSAGAAAPVKINTANGGAAVYATTNFVDTTLTSTNLTNTVYTYSVRPVTGSVNGTGGTEVPEKWANPLSGPFTLPFTAPTGTPTRQYVPVPLTPTPDDVAMGVSYDVKFCWVGDFDGDGNYDFVVERTNPNLEARQWLQAYKFKHDGTGSTLLWQMNMGPNSVDHYNITPGSSSIGIGHGDNVTVYDLDGDGKAEVIVRTANGVVLANGTTLVAPDNEVQYISIIDGETGVEKARATVPIPASWATKTHVQGQMGIVYADGSRPSLFFHPSNRNPDSSFNKCAITWDYRSGALTQRWVWLESGHTAEGHQIRLADVDNDGKDEYVDVGNVVKADGSGQINENVLTEVVHGDRFHVTDIDPDRPGLETFLIQQNNGNGLATAYHAADKSAVLKKWYAGGVVDVGRGTVGGFVPGLQGLQFFSTQPGVFDAKGNQIYASGPFPPETIWWDADLGREFVSTIGASATSPGIDKFNTADGSTGRVFTIYSDPQAPNSPYNNYIAYGGRPQFWGDILGDWREEMIVVASDNSELRIYTTKNTDTAKTGGGVPFRIYTLMHNPQYRIQATTKGYVQSSYVDYYLGYNMTPPPPPPMVDAKLVWKGGAGTSTWDTGTTASWLNSGVGSTYADGDTVRLDLSGNNTTAVMLNGTLQPGALTVYNPSDYTFAGTGTLAGTMKLTKAGAGALVLPGTHTFSGKTTVWDGALVVHGNLQSSPVTVWGGTWGGAAAAGKTGGRIGGTGTFSQPVTIKYRGAVTPGAGMNSAGTLTFASGLTAEDGATFALDLSDDPTNALRPSDRIVVTGGVAGNLTLTGTVKIVINPLHTALAAGTYTLATYSGTLTGGLANLAVVLPVGTPYTLSAGGGAITLTVPVTRAPAAVIWRGTGGAWELAASQNWLRAGSPDVFVSGDAVTFDATGAASPTATLSTGLPTAGVTVNAATDYTFTGAGSLTGGGGLTKSGAGTLTVTTTNDYAGPTTITGGVLAVATLGDAGAPSSIGAASTAASNLVINGGTLRLTGSQTNTNRNATLGASGGTLDIATSGSSLQISGALSGTGRLTKAGPGTLLLASASTYSGGTIIDGGTIYLAGETPNVSGLGSGAITINGGRLKMSDVQGSETAPWNLIVPAGATARLDADGRCSLTGTLTGSGEFTYYTGYIRTDLKGNWSAFTGQIFAVTDDDGGDFRITNTAGYPSAALDLGDQIYAYYNSTPPSGGQTIDIGALSGVATSNLKGGPTGGRIVTYRIGGKSLDSVFAGTLTDSAGPTAITKLGTAVFTLTGANTYTGATTVSAGALLVNGSLAGTNVTVANGATLGGNGTIRGNVTVNTGGRLAFVASGGVITGLNITGNLTMNGTISIAPAAGSSGFPEGTHTIATYSGALGGTYTFAWLPAAGSTQTATFATSTPGLITMTVASMLTPLVWTGATTTAWDTATANWTRSGTPTAFATPENVIFNDTATTGTVAIAGPVSPGSVTFSNATLNYALSGTGGGLAGYTAISKSGAAKATLYSANGHTGATTINGGILALGNDGSTTAGQYQAGGATGAGAASTSLGSGAILINATGQLRLGGRGSSTVFTYISDNQITLNGGTLVSYDGQQQLDGAITVGAGGAGFITAWNQKNLWLAGALSGSGNVTIDDLNAGGTDTSRARVRVSAANNPYNGTVTINAASAGYHGGRLAIENDSALINATVIDNNSAVPALLFTVATARLGALGGTADFGLPTTSLTVGGNNASTTYSGAMTGTGALIKTGAGTFTLAGTSNFTGATNINAGTLRITGSVAGTPSLTVAAGATLELSAGTLAVAGPITNGGTVRLYGTTALSSTGAFTNNGMLDLINGPQSLPANFVNSGVVLTASVVRVQSFARTGADLALTIQSYAGHTYQLQRRDLLTAGAWGNVGPVQSGSGAVLTFTHSGGAAGAQSFYRITVGP